MTCLTSDRLFGSVLIERGSEVGGGDQRVQVGTLLQIIDTQESPDGRWSVLAAGVERLQVVEWLADDPFPRCIADRLPDGPQTPETDRLRDLAVDLIDQLVRRHFAGRGRPPELPHLDEDPSLASFQLLSLSPLGPLDQLKALQMPDPSSRLRFLVELLESEILVFDALSGGDGNQPSDGSSN
jgi:Lon protease-like protein